jgi:hypothetical protein
MKLLTWIVVVASLQSGRAFASAGVSWAAKEDYKNPKNEMGMCSSAGKEQLYIKTGYCQSIIEILTNKEYCPPGCDPKKCPAAMFEQIRDRYLRGTDIKTAGSEKYKREQEIEFEYNCVDGKGKELKDLAKDKDITKFANVFANWIATIVIETSDWDREAKGNAGGEGLLGLTRKDMEDPKYRCGCELKNPPDPLPGPEDGHHSLTCGTYIAMYNIVEDGESLYSGKNRRPPSNGSTVLSSNDNKDDRKGAAKIFQILETPADGDRRTSDRQTKMIDKLNNFCKQSAHSPAVRTFDEDVRRLNSGEIAR